jgi:hypothetical protein
MVKSFIASNNFLNNIDSLNTSESILNIYIETNHKISMLSIDVLWKDFQLLLHYFDWINIRSLGFSVFEESWNNEMKIELSDWIYSCSKKVYKDDFVQDVCFAEGYVNIISTEDGTSYRADCVSIYCHFDEGILSFSINIKLDLFGRYPHQQNIISHSITTVENNIGIIIQSINQLSYSHDFSLNHVVCDDYPSLNLLIKESIKINHNEIPSSISNITNELNHKIVTPSIFLPIPESNITYSNTNYQERLTIKLDSQITITLIRSAENTKWKLIRSNTTKPIMEDEIIARLPEKYR